MKALKLIPRLWILVSLLFTIHNTAQNNIVGYEYAFNDGEGLQFVSIAPTSDFNLNTNIDVSALTNDVNIIHLRFLDENGLWSSIVSKIFINPPEASATASTIVGYEYGFDNDDTPTYVPISPTADFNLITDIDTNSLTNDVNVLYIRFKDDIGQWSSIISKIFVKPPEALTTASTIVGYEYGFNDGENIQYVPISPSADFNLVSDIDVNSLTNDVNIFYIRFKDDIGQWSSFISKIFVKPPEAFATASAIVGYEYGFNDAENIQYIPVSPSSDFNLVSDIDVSSLVNDVNIFHIRFKDDIGQWSSIISKIFVKPPDSFASASTIVGYEYGFNDAENIQYVPITPTADFNLTTNIDVSALTNHVNVFQIRFLDDIGQWSSMISKIFIKPQQPEDLTGNQLVSYEYWFDNDISTKETFDIDPNATDYILTEISLLNLWEGEHTLHTQFKDAFGKYSLVMTDTINKAVKPYARYTPDKYSVCVGETITFTNTSVDYDSQTWNFDDGETSSDNNTTHTFTAAGIYEVELSIEDIDSGLTDAISQVVEVFEIPTNGVSVSATLPACYGETVTLTANDMYRDYLWSNGATTRSIEVTTEGVYTVEVRNPNSTTCAITSDPITVSFKPEIDNTVTYTGLQDVISANLTGASYQWIDCSSNLDLDGETNQQLNLTQTGDFAVEITFNGCTVISECVTVTTLSLANIDLKDTIKVYPNPFNNSINIKSSIPLSLELFTVDGRLVLKSKSESGVFPLDLSNLSSGLFILKAKGVNPEHSEKTTSFRIVKD